ncbi:MAG: GHKL domain-containing protein [Endomicrobium sp.]|jgi:PAS domain S-box-containing protein|nr:GHKL domain-containing protein [Endomicrobium sp.]
MKAIEEDNSIHKAYEQSVQAYAIKRRTNEKNGFSYLVEENAWILSLPYLYPNKHIYVIHVGNVTESTTILWSVFGYLRDSVRLLFPYFSMQKFANLADFKSEYENKRNYGYFIDDEDLINVIANMSKKENLSREALLKLLLDERSQKELLTNIIAKMPGHIYWLNNKYIYMGCNDVQAKDLGLSSTNEILGKTILDLLPEREAKKHNNINKLVIEKCKVYKGEEKASMYNGFRICMSHKLPLTNSAGKNVGLLGISVDITDRKKKEELKKELEVKKELYNTARWVSHDLAQPVTALKGYLNLNKSLSEEEKRIFEEVARSIENIVDRLLQKYRGTKDRDESDYTQVKLCLERIINQIREQNKEIEIKSMFNSEDKFVFIKGNFVDFSRMLLNLLNNGVEAIEKKKGEISVGYKVKGEEVEIRGKDNGQGMPKEIAEKLMKGEKVETSKKKSGHGLGMEQVQSVLKAIKGQMRIESKENVGTEIILTFPKAEKPRWFADKIEIKKGYEVVIVDDEELVHEVWKEKLKEYEKEIRLKFFKQGKEALNYLKSLKNKEKVLLIADYELKEDINGIDIIEEAGMKERHVLVTNMYLGEIKDFSRKSEYLKIFHKNLLQEIPFVRV